MEDVGLGGSGILPAASLSNIDSCSSSWFKSLLSRRGAAGNGLLRSVCDRFRGDDD